MSSARTPAALPFWAELQRLLNVLHALFGGPEEVAFQWWAKRDWAMHLHRWLSAAESFARRLVLVEAAALYAVSNHPPAAPRKPQRARKRRVIEHWPETPGDWRVRFRLEPTPSKRAARRAGKRGPSAPLVNVWPMAERYEALLRVLADPAPYARRLTRRLCRPRSKRVDRLRAAAPLPDYYLDREICAAFTPLYEASLARFENSS